VNIDFFSTLFTYSWAIYRGGFTVCFTVRCTAHMTDSFTSGLWTKCSMGI